MIDQKLLKISALTEEIGEIIKNGAEAAVRSDSVKKVFLKFSQNSQENNCTSLFLNKVAFKRFMETESDLKQKNKLKGFILKKTTHENRTLDIAARVPRRNHPVKLPKFSLKNLVVS